MKKIVTFLLITTLSFNLFCQTMEVKSQIDWTKNKFISSISLDLKKANIQLPSGKLIASNIIKTKSPSLMKDSILSLYVDSTYYLGDLVQSEDVTLEEITDIIENGSHTPNIISLDGKTISTTNTMKINNISNLMLHHKYPYTPEEPIETVPSRAFTGIIIDARGAIPVHGEYIKSNVYPCFFPMIWDSEMNLIYEKNISDRKKAETDGIVYYHYSDDKSLYENRIGTDPLYIKATKVYGRNRTDPIIKQKDALKILTVPENKKLLKEGKIVILLDKENLIYDIKIPQKDPSYYATFNELKKYNYNPEDNIKITDSLPGILFSVDLKFIPDSPRLLPAERPRIAKIAEMLSEIINKDEFTILIEGHTADIGKPIGQMNLSIERTKTIRDALIQEGIPEKLFTYKGYGGTRPIATNQTEEGRAQNRRVNIIARPKATYIQRDW